MPFRRAPGIANPRSPTFFWQGALILLPAIVLCGFGLYSLRQDRALAEHQAMEQARTIAREALQRIQRGPLQAMAAPEPKRVERAKNGLAAPEDDPILQAARAPEPRVAFQLDAAGQLLYPPPLSPLPPPQPLDVEELNSEQKAAWIALQNSFGAAPFAGANDTALTAWRKTAPPRRFAAIADYEAGLACLKSERGSDATTLFNGVAESTGGVLAEDGFPLAYFAQAQLLREGPFLQDGARKALLDRFCSQAIAAPNALSEAALSWAVQYDLGADAAKRWREVYAAHTLARAVASAHAADSVEPLAVADEKYLLRSEATSGERWIQAVSLRGLEEAVGRVVQAQAIPEQFAVEVGLGKMKLLAASEHADAGEPLAAASGQVTGERSDWPLVVRVTLADPARYYAAQRSRTLRFAGLIALSALAVSIGFFSARWAFQRQQRLSEMKTNFVSSVSHELRAPIASVRFMAEELELGAAPSPEKLRNYHRFIVQECRRLSAVIENVLDFSRREQGREQFEFEGSDLVRLLEETARLMRSYGADKQVTITTTVTGEPEEVEADGRALQRLLVNLLDNAIKHSPEGGAVRTGLDFQPDHVALWVEDDGPGIPQEEHERIFERFYRIGSELRRETQGVGLGLSIVKHIATVHGGTIRVRSEPGRGSRFALELPLQRRSGFPALES